MEVPQGGFMIGTRDSLLFVGSCFAQAIGRRFAEDGFRAEVNPYGVMYNPASILHTVERCAGAPDVAVFTLGTNHVYILRETGEIVDNCQKRPQRLFEERELSVDECHGYLEKAVETLQGRNPAVRVIVTVSPIRYAKYGFHGSQLSKATLLLAADKLCRTKAGAAEYFPAYEIVNDELRDYRFYKEDMLHPTEQAAEYIWQRLRDSYFSREALEYMGEWLPVKAALAHRPFNPESEEYKAFRAEAERKAKKLSQKYMM